MEEAVDIRETTERVIGDVLANGDFIEETFDNRSRPASIFRSLSRRYIAMVTEDYKVSLSRLLVQDDCKQARRAAKMLNGIYQTAAAYPSLEIILHCYFRTESISPQKIIGYVRERLVATESQTDLELLHFRLLEELSRFGREFEAVIGNSARSESEFREAIQLLAKKVERLGGRHGVSAASERGSMSSADSRTRMAG